jgi:hypothetical protein
MYSGPVTFTAKIRRNDLTFARVEFDPHTPGVNRAEIEGREPPRMHQAA